jgi:hypothetical protein
MFPRLRVGLVCCENCEEFFFHPCSSRLNHELKA